MLTIANAVFKNAYQSQASSNPNFETLCTRNGINCYRFDGPDDPGPINQDRINWWKGMPAGVCDWTPQGWTGSTCSLRLTTAQTKASVANMVAFLEGLNKGGMPYSAMHPKCLNEPGRLNGAATNTLWMTDPALIQMIGDFYVALASYGLPFGSIGSPTLYGQEEQIGAMIGQYVAAFGQTPPWTRSWINAYRPTGLIPGLTPAQFGAAAVLSGQGAVTLAKAAWSGCDVGILESAPLWQAISAGAYNPQTYAQYWLAVKAAWAANPHIVAAGSFGWNGSDSANINQVGMVGPGDVLTLTGSAVLAELAVAA